MFKLILDFIKVYWRELFSLILLISSSILFALRKKPELNKTAAILSELFLKIPMFIDLVEKPGHGSEKKALVLDLCKEFLTHYGISDFDIFKETCDSFIESVLNAPQKTKED